MKKQIYLIIIIAVAAFLLNSQLSAQSSVQFNKKYELKVNLQMPERNSKHYIEDHSQNKKLKTHIRLLNPDMCPSFKNYTSKPAGKREKNLTKGKR